MKEMAKLLVQMSEEEGEWNELIEGV